MDGWEKLLALSGALPGEDQGPVDRGGRLPQVHHPDGRLHVVVVHDGAVGHGRVQLAVDGQRGVAVLPLFPAVPVVVDPRLAVEGLVRD